MIPVISKSVWKMFLMKLLTINIQLRSSIFYKQIKNKFLIIYSMISHRNKTNIKMLFKITLITLPIKIHI